ncbi:molybdopterin molybdotransferase MoeA [Trebonia sp.]|uniref:molybdopterin molybdotransferase MoeA n=1 Tax=Trebonia sp. TaxID=2767075 RepID=UPI00262CEE6F|nr:molybdopterin molybdotransferase MoeA [Trebonia sp.]
MSGPAPDSAAGDASGADGDGAGRPSPRLAYAQWMDACARAGWLDAPVVEQVPATAALGRVTAAPVHARWPSPRSDCAAMDGIAVAAASLGAAGAAAEVALPASAFQWIDTGDPLPPGTDTVVERERVLPGDDGGVRITGGAGPVRRGRHVRTTGEDFLAGQVLVPAGRRLRPGDLAVAVAAGHAALAVARQPVVAIIPTGDEIRPAGSTIRPGEIIDSNSLMLASRCRQVGALPAVSDVQPDDPDTLAAEIRRSALAADLVLVIAGSSRGRGDHTAAVLADVGGLAVAGAAVRPGHPVLLGHVKLGRPRAHQPAGAAPVIGLPGYPLAAAVIFEVFARPVIAAIQGWEPTERTQRVTLDRDWTSAPGVEDWVPVTLTWGQDGTLATPGRRGAGSTSQLARADAWWPIPIGRGHFTRGSVIEVLAIWGA